MTEYIDVRQLADAEPLEADVCILGGGAAGLTIARELAGTAARVAVLEGGGLYYSEESQDLFRIDNIGRAYPTAKLSRLRFFGGTTNQWGGRCMALRPSVFEKRAWIPHSGWPFGREVLDPYYDRAFAFMRIGDADTDLEAIARAENLDVMPFDPARLRTRIARVNRLRFGKDFLEDLGDAPNITVYLNANISSINRDRAAGRVNDVALQTLDGKGFGLSAKVFILCCGGIENARLLLNSRNVESAGLGNSEDLVGRFFMEHLWYPRSNILPADQSREFKFYSQYYLTEDDWYLRGFLDLPEHLSRELEIADYRIELEAERSPVCDLAVRRARRLPYDILRGAGTGRIYNSLVRIVTNYDKVWRYFTAGDDHPLTYKLLNYSEQVPNPNSRVTLSSSKDALGLNRAALDWRLSDIDLRTIAEAQRVVALEVGRSEFGRLEKEDIIQIGEESRELIYPTFHHMGTTRMDPDPKQGVVDTECRVHGLGNFYIAGGSVFPCGGYEHPTFTILALAMRIADNVKSSLKLA